MTADASRPQRGSKQKIPFFTTIVVKNGILMKIEVNQ